jgi:Ca2+-binding EF-hand superfamily protein
MEGADKTYALTSSQIPEDEEQAQHPVVANPTLVPSTRHWRIGASVGALGVLLVIAACVNQGIPRAQPDAPNKSKEFDATVAQVRNVVAFYRASAAKKSTLASTMDNLADELQADLVPEVAEEAGEASAEAANFGQASEPQECLALKKEEDFDFEDGRLEELKEQFKTLDTDGSGYMNKAEVIAMLKSMGPAGMSVSDEMAEKALKEVDVCAPVNLVGLLEFLNAFDKSDKQTAEAGGPPPPPPDCDTMWSIINTDADDYVTATEVKNFMPPGSAPEGMTTDQVVGLMIMFNDKDGDSKLAREEFETCFCQKP